MLLKLDIAAWRGAALVIKAENSSASLKWRCTARYHLL